MRHLTSIAQCLYHAWCRSSVAALAFLDGDSGLSDTANSAGSSSPLLILTEDRQYLVAASATSADSTDLPASADLSLPQGAFQSVNMLIYSEACDGILIHRQRSVSYVEACLRGQINVFILVMREMHQHPDKRSIC